MNDLQKRFEEETGLEMRYGAMDVMMSYINWLESQLTWRKVDDLPKCDGFYFVRGITAEKNPRERIERVMYKVPFGWCLLDINITHYLPIPELS